MCEIELPWPPSVNHYKVIRKGKMILAQKVRDYFTECRFCVNSMYGKNLDSLLEITIELYPPDLRRRDIDNCIKPILDGMTYSKVWLDDSQIKAMHVYMKEKIKGGKVILKISEAKCLA